MKTGLSTDAEKQAPERDAIETALKLYRRMENELNSEFSKPAEKKLASMRKFSDLTPELISRMTLVAAISSLNLTLLRDICPSLNKICETNRNPEKK